MIDCLGFHQTHSSLADWILLLHLGTWVWCPLSPQRCRWQGSALCWFWLQYGLFLCRCRVKVNSVCHACPEDVCLLLMCSSGSIFCQCRFYCISLSIFMSLSCLCLFMFVYVSLIQMSNILLLYMFVFFMKGLLWNLFVWLWIIHSCTWVHDLSCKKRICSQESYCLSLSVFGGEQPKTSFP